MAHPLYHQAFGMVGRYVYVHHLNGQTYPGILQSVTQSGIYLMPYRPRTVLTHADETYFGLTFAVNKQDVNADFQPVYAPGAYFAFGALAGLSLGALASPYVW